MVRGRASVFLLRQRKETQGLIILPAGVLEARKKVMCRGIHGTLCFKGLGVRKRGRLDSSSYTLREGTL